MDLTLTRMNLDIAKFIGRSDDIISVWYIGSVEQFDEFCRYVIIKFPNLIKFRVNAPVSCIPDLLIHRLEYLDCSNTQIKKLYFGEKLRCLIACNTAIKLQDVLSNVEKMNYVKLGSIGDGSRVTIDSSSEYDEYIQSKNFFIK